MKWDDGGKNHVPPRGVIQMDAAMLHFISKEIKAQTTLLLAPASTFIEVRVLFNITFYESRERIKE